MCSTKEVAELLQQQKEELIEKTHQIVNQAIMSAPLHKTAPETRKEFNKININMSKLAKDIEYIKKSIEDNSHEHKEMIDTMKQYIDKIEVKFDNLDGKYSGKWVGKVLIWVGAIVGTAIIGALISLIIK